MLIGISGKIGSGKDTVGKIIQYLKFKEEHKRDLNTYLCNDNVERPISHLSFEQFIEHNTNSLVFKTIQIKKFADKLKDTVCLWTGCTREQLEDHNFKDTEIGEEWKRWRLQVPVDLQHTKVKTLDMLFNSETEAWEYNKNILMYSKSVVTVYSEVVTYRMLMQLLGTECMRNTIHVNGWINALFSEYKPQYVKRENPIDIDSDSTTETVYPNWCITDMRFPNELEAIKYRGGITIRVERPVHRCDCTTLEAEDCNKKCSKSVNLEHESETALDGAVFDYIIHNDGTIEELVEKVKVILVEENLL